MSNILTEVSQFDLRMEVTRQFPFLYADGNRWAIPKSSDGGAVVLELSRINSSDQPFHLSIDEVRAPNRKTIIESKDSAEIMTVYNKSDLLERQFLLIDPAFANSIAIDPLPAIIVDISLATTDPKWKLGCPLAIVSNGGICEVRIRRRNVRVYDEILLDVSQVWSNCCAPRRPEHFDSLETITKYYSDLIFTATCWFDQIIRLNRWKLFCGTRSGLVVTLDLHGNQGDILSITKTDLESISMMKHFSCNDQANNELLFVASKKGLLKVFRKSSDTGLTEASVLWGTKDRMALHCLEVNFIRNTNHVCVATSKGAYVLVFLLSPDGQLLKKGKLFYENIVVTGLQFIDDYQLLVCAINGHTSLLRLSFSEAILIESESIKNDFDTNVYQVLGMVATRNKIAWIFLQFPIQLYEHSFRNPTMLTICSLSGKDPLETIEEHPERKIYEFADCAEMMRCTALKFGVPDKYLDFEYNGTEISESFIRKLKVWTLVLSTRICYFQKKLRKDDARLTQKRVENIRTVIEVYLAYKRLSHLSTLKELTNAQKMSGVYYRRKMLVFYRDVSTYQWLGEIQTIFRQIILTLLRRTEEFNQAECEKCVYCDDYVNLESGTCKENHKVPRCCISFLQIPPFSARACETCQYGATDDENMLKRILCPNETISCPLCDGPLIGAKSQIYLT